MYNKANEERKWKQWKDDEERILRQYGMSESKIAELRKYDLAMFNADRRFRERYFTNNDLMDYVGTDCFELPIRDFDDILEQIESIQLYKKMKSLNHQMMTILYLKIIGYSVAEIAEIVGLKESVVRERIRSVRKKLKNL